MDNVPGGNSRRNFIKGTGMTGLGMCMPTWMVAPGLIPPNIHEFGKREGFTDHISILVSMMDWMRSVILQSAEGLGQKDLDFLLDGESNTIGALLLHLAATERFYQIHTFEEKAWGDFGREDLERWEVAGRLGSGARMEIKGHTLPYYTDKLNEIREVTKLELGKRDDQWLMVSTPFFANRPTNNYCKWFHVVEHESNHNGQIKLIRGRIG